MHMCNVCKKDSGKNFLCFECWLMRYHGKTPAQLSDSDLDGAETLYDIENDPANFEEPDNQPW